MLIILTILIISIIMLLFILFMNFNIFVKILITLLAIMTFIFFHPSSEIMKCNEDLQCKVDKTYFNVINFETQFDLTANSKLNTSVSNIPLLYKNINEKYYLHFSITKNKNQKYIPFIFYYELLPDKIIAENHSSFIKKTFDDYLLNPQKTFVIESKASLVYSIPLIFIIAILIALVLYPQEDN